IQGQGDGYRSALRRAGRQPKDHRRREGVDRFVTSRDISYPTIFELASHAGLRVASLNMPVTFPPLSGNGVIVSGFPCPLDPERVAHPPRFLQTYPDYGVDVEDTPGPL